MKKGLKIFTAMLLIVSISAAIYGCKQKNNDIETLKIVYNYGMPFAPVSVMIEQGLIEKHYGGNVDVEWQIISSGVATNEGIVAGDIDAGFLGTSPFITGISKKVPYKMFSSVSKYAVGLNTSDENLNSLSDFTEEHKIATVSIGSNHHTVLMMAAEKELGDPRALDKNIINMSHPDGMQALLSSSVSAHLTIPPYLDKELDETGIHEITSVREEFSIELIGVASQSLYDRNPALYDALCLATKEAVEYVNENTDSVAEMLKDSEGVTFEVMKEYLTNGNCIYETEPGNIIELAKFMERIGQVENAPESMSEYCYDNLLQ